MSYIIPLTWKEWMVELESCAAVRIGQQSQAASYSKGKFGCVFDETQLEMSSIKM